MQDKINYKAVKIKSEKLLLVPGMQFWRLSIGMEEMDSVFAKKFQLHITITHMLESYLWLLGALLLYLVLWVQMSQLQAYLPFRAPICSVNGISWSLHRQTHWTQP